MIKFNKIIDFFKNKYANFGFEHRIEDDKLLILEADICIDDIKGMFYVKAQVYNDGHIKVEFVYEKIKRCFEAYKIINDFNSTSPFIKAYIMENSEGYYLKLYYKSIVIPNEEDICLTIEKMLYAIFDENAVELYNNLESYLTYMEE